MNFPPHFSLAIYHNEHKNCYMDIREYMLDDQRNIVRNLWDEEFITCVAENEIWELKIWPTVALTFHAVYSSSLEGCIEKINAIYLREKWDGNFGSN